MCSNQPKVELRACERSLRPTFTNHVLRGRRTLMQVLSRAQKLGLSIIHGEPCVLVELGYYSPGGLGSSDGGDP